jgi:hypothetical protein
MAEMKPEDVRVFKGGGLQLPTVFGPKEREHLRICGCRLSEQN